MHTTVFDEFCRIVYEKSGISLNESKEAMLSARLGKRVRELGLRDCEEYLEFLRQDATGDETVQLLDMVSTNVTSFFREPAHFAFMKDIVAGWLKAGQTRFRFWSAASSTGEEPYSMAMTFLELAGGRAVDAKILATDISTRVLLAAREGRYDGKKIDGVPPLLRERYFHCVRHPGATAFTVRPDVREMVTFARINLAAPPFVMRGPFDVVFCRNVMIYFDEGVRSRLLDEIHRLLRPGGYLLVGHAESLSAQGKAFRSLKPSIYLKA